MAPTQKQRQIKEIIKCGKNPIHFFNKHVKIQHPIKGAIPFNTYKFQDACVKDFNEHRFNIILKSRQLGLSTITAAYCAWLAIFHKDKSVLVIATKLSVAQNFIRKVKEDKKAYLDFNESSIISDNKTYDALYYNKN